MYFNRMCYIRRLFIFIFIKLTNCFSYLTNLLSHNENIKDFRLHKNLNNNIEISVKINNTIETMLIDEFVISGLFMGLKDIDKDEIVAFIIKNKPSVKEYSFQILENKKINIYLDGQIYKEELSKYELLQHRDIINSADDLTYNKILKIKDYSCKIYDE